MDEIVIVTNKLLSVCKPEQIEVEARIRRQLISRHSVQLLIDHFGGWNVTEYSEKKKISKNNRKCTYRSRVTNRNSETICKSSIAREDVNDAWCTVHVSTEAPVPSMQRALDTVSPVHVTRHRITMDGHYVDVISAESELRVEVEARDARELNPDMMLLVVSRMCAVLQGNDEPVGYYDWKTVAHVASFSFGPFCIERKHFQKPRTMTVDVLYRIARNSEDWAVTPKVDGVRKFLILFNGRAYSMGNTKDVTALEGPGLCEDIGVCVVDCEFAHGTYYAFDVPVYNGQYCGSLELGERTSKIADVAEVLKNVCLKPYEKFASFEKLQNWYDLFSARYDIDGLIFSNTKEGYMQSVPKWKVHSTVDLTVEDQVLYTCDGHTVDIACTTLPDSSFGVWEFSFDSDRLIAKRSRPDKPQANSLHIVYKNLYSSVPGSLFTGRGFYLMRKYHNRVKRWALTEARDSGATLFDIGTGQGGDIEKWKRMSHIYCVEPNKESVNEMWNRCDDTTKHKITVLNKKLADVTTGSIDRKVDIFTAFFCMNQWSDRDWEALDDLITTKGSKKCRLLAIAMTSPTNHKSENLDIRMKGNSSYNIKIHGTRIMDIDENVVFAKWLENRMLQCKLSLKIKEILNTEDFMTAEERKLSSMYTLFMFSKKKAL